MPPSPHRKQFRAALEQAIGGLRKHDPYAIVFCQGATETEVALRLNTPEALVADVAREQRHEPFFRESATARKLALKWCPERWKRQVTIGATPDGALWSEWVTRPTARPLQSGTAASRRSSSGPLPSHSNVSTG